MFHLMRVVKCFMERVNGEEWDNSDNKNFTDNDETYILVKWWIIMKC